jgi:hypothetical protein
LLLIRITVSLNPNSFARITCVYIPVFTVFCGTLGAATHFCFTPDVIISHASKFNFSLSEYKSFLPSFDSGFTNARVNVFSLLA